MRSRLFLWIHFFGFLSFSASEPEVPEIFCHHLESCVLPCVFDPGEDPVIHWIKDPGRAPVHIYFYGQHQPQHQHENYTGRTSLSEDGIRIGNASLLLQKVRVSDEGRYRCFANTITHEKETESYVNLKVCAPVLQMSLQQQNKQLLSRLENIYPRPAVTWTFSPDPQDEPQTTFTVSESGLFSVLSSINLTKCLPLEYSFNISTDRCWRSATYRRNSPISASGSVTVPCSEPSAPVKTLIWRFNQSETISTRTGSELVYTESWRQFVEELTESNSLVLKDLTQDQLGLFTCELSTKSEQFIIDTEVNEVTARTSLGVMIFLGLAAVIIPALICFLLRCRRTEQRHPSVQFHRSSATEEQNEDGAD